MKLLDVTLREGEQRPGVRYTVDQKIEAARALDHLGIEYLQVGFPVADNRTKRVCDQVDLDAATTGLARAIPGDVEAAIEAGVDIVDLFIPTSNRQLKYILRKEFEEVQEAAIAAAELAHAHGVEVHCSAMDGFRTEPAVLDELFGTLDATVYTIADTVGSQTPAGVERHLNALDTEFSQLGVHFHDDLGVATANALTAARMGVTKIDASVAGLGERAGNTAVEELIAASLVGECSLDLEIDPKRLLPTMHAVLEVLAEDVPSEKALIGGGVFSHESGLHTAAMLDDPGTFEPFDPARFGGERTLLFGPGSGRGAARRLLEHAGNEATDERTQRLLEELHSVDNELTLAEAMNLATQLE